MRISRYICGLLAVFLLLAAPVSAFALESGGPVSVPTTQTPGPSLESGENPAALTVLDGKAPEPIVLLPGGTLEPSGLPAELLVTTKEGGEKGLEVVWDLEDFADELLAGEPFLLTPVFTGRCPADGLTYSLSLPEDLPDRLRLAVSFEEPGFDSSSKPGTGENTCGQPEVIELLEDWHITGEVLMTTINPALLSNFPLEDIETMLGGRIYPWGLTIRTNGHCIIVEDGGTLSLGLFDSVSSPCTVEGDDPEGLIQVQPGGSLRLAGATFPNALLAVYQEDGSCYEWSGEKDAAPPARYGVPVATRTDQEQPLGLKVFGSQSWKELLPAELYAFLNCGGTTRLEHLRVEWDTAAVLEELEAGKPCTLSGQLFWEEAALRSWFVPRAEIQFFPDGPVKITKAAMTLSGSGDWLATVTFEEPCDSTDIWLEQSPDEGASWSPVSKATLDQRFDGSWNFLFYLSDAAPRLLRVVVEGGPNAGAGEPVELSPPDMENSENGGDPDDDTDSGNDDFSGNRGGGTAVLPPDRQPASSEAEQASAPPQSSQLPNTQPSSAPEVKPEEPSADLPGQNSGVDGSEPAVRADSAKTQPETANGPPLPPVEQAAAAAAGIAACAGIGAVVLIPGLRNRLLMGLGRFFKHLK